MSPRRVASDARDGGPVRMQGSQGAGRSPELDGHVRELDGERGAGAVEPGAPAGRDQPERGGQGLLAERAGDHRGVAVGGGEPGGGVGGAAQVVEHDLPGPADEQHRGGVHDVLAGGAGMHRATGGTRGRAQQAHQRDHRVAALDRGAAQLGRVDLHGGRGRGDRVGVGLRDDAVLGGGGRQRDLHRDERRHPRRVVEPVGHPVGAEQRIEQRAAHERAPAGGRTLASTARWSLPGTSRIE